MAAAAASGHVCVWCLVLYVLSFGTRIKTLTDAVVQALMKETSARLTAQSEQGHVCTGFLFYICKAFTFLVEI